jgi:hypothetical protein
MTKQFKNQLPANSTDSIFALINKEEQRQIEMIGLIPSENQSSEAVRACLSSCLSSKYSEGYPKRRYYEGNQIIDEIEIDISSAGDARLQGKTNYLKADLSSAGDLNAFDLEAKKGDVRVSSAGDANVFVTEEAIFDCSSAGSIEFKGEPRIKNISTSSAGSVNKKQ